VPANRRRGRPQGKCHRKQTARARSIRASEMIPRARAKRCGKSAPHPWQQGRQGKPHREQDRIGVAVIVQGVSARDRSQGCSRPAARVGRKRRIARCVPDEWPSNPARGGQNPAYRLSGNFSVGRFRHWRTVRPSRAKFSPQTCPQERNTNYCTCKNRLGVNRDGAVKSLRKP
jgi:hypothetical protein